MSTPQTNINIVSGVAIDSRYRHSIYFANQDAQLAYFGGKVVKRLSAYSYCRKSWTLKVDATMEEARKWNYLYFQNTPSGKWWFYFINDVEYKGERSVELTLELDVIQTYMFEWVMKRCHIERQHTTSDKFGENQVEEDLDTGELTCNAWTDVQEIEELCLLIMSTYDLAVTSNTSNASKILATCYNNVFGGLGIYATLLSDWQAVGIKLSQLSDAGIIDGVVSMWMYPKRMVSLGKYTDGTNATWTNGVVFKPVANMIPHNLELTLDYSPLSDIDGYVPKNAKTLQYPYNFMYVSNNQGGGAVYKYERFNGGVDNGEDNTFKVYALLTGSYSPEGTVQMVFPSYDNMPFETGLSIGGYPTCAWNADAYKIWLAQNQNSVNLSNTLGGLSIVAGSVTAAASIATGNVAGAVGGVAGAVGGVKTIANNLSMKKDRAIQPPQARGTHSASTNIMSGKQTFTIYFRYVTAEHARMIDNYFTQFGYAIKRLDYPNIHARTRYTYIKTNGCTIGGTICNSDRVKIESIFDEGITFWVDGDGIGNYSANNDPIASNT